MVGPSGSGKTSIGEVLVKNDVPRLITTTTRKPRTGEVDGVDYYFRDFSAVDSDEFVEQTLYNGNRYGLTKEEVRSKLAQHDIVHVSLDKSGTEAICKTFPEEAFIVFVSISEEEMIHRMKIRGDALENIEKRVLFSRKTDELTPLECADLVIVNENVETSAQKILDEVAKHEKRNV